MILKFSLSRFITQIATLVTSSVQSAIRNYVTDGPGPIGSSSRSAAGVFRSYKMRDVNDGWMPVGSKAERIYALFVEFCQTVSGFITQCTPFPISWTDSEGKAHSKNHRPDFVVFYEPSQNATTDDLARWQAAKFIEVKNVDYLRAHQHKGGGRYTFDEKEGRWRSPCAEVVAQDLFGFGYEVISTEDLNRIVDPVISNNAEFLHDFFDKRVQDVPPDIAQAVLDRVKLEPGITLRQLLNSIKDLKSDHFLKLLVDERIFVDLKRCQLDLAPDVRVFTDRQIAVAYYALTDCPPASPIGHAPAFVAREELIVCGKRLTVVLPGDTIIQCEDENGNATPLKRSDLERFLAHNELRSLGIPSDKANAAFEKFRTTPPDKLLAGLERYAKLKDRVEGSKRRSGPNEAKLSAADRYWLKRARIARLQFGNGALGCIDEKHKRGRRPVVLSVTQQQALDAGIGVYADKRAPSLVSAYAEYLRICEEKGVKVVLSRKAFRARIKRLLVSELIRRREGAAAAAQHESPQSGENLLDLTGRYFFHVGYMDEFKFDLALICPELGIGLGQAWVIALLDGYSRTVLALVVTFYEPSYVTTMMALRACVARWKRLPRVVSMDNGPGFRNASLTLLLKYYDDIHPEWRKIESPRGGSLVERFGGSTNQRIANELPGGTKVLNRHRGRLSKTHDPIQLAVHSLMDADDTLVEWANDTYDKLPHAGLNGRSPRDVREESLREHGEREHLTIQLDDTFLIMSLPAPEGDGTLKVQAHDGVQVDGFLYWNKDAFESPGVEGSRVQVRYDPFNITHVYAFVCGVWVECECRKLARLKRLSPEHLCMLTIEIRRRQWGYYSDYTEVTKLVRAFINGKAKTQQELEDILRAKQSAKLAIRNFPGVDLGDLDDNAEAGEASAPKPPIPALPGGNANPGEYKELS